MDKHFQIAPASLGFVRTAVLSPELRVADVEFNCEIILAALARAASRGCRLALFPELSLTGYSCGDLFYQALLRERACQALRPLAEATARYDIATVVGLPLEIAGKLYNCAALLAEGRVVGVVPKTYLPTTNEFYEERWFTPGPLATAREVDIDGQAVPFGVDLLFSADNVSGCVLGIEICEDLWAVQPPSGAMALAGATILLNPSASNELLAKVDYRRDLVRQQSARCLAAYLYAGSGPNESTTDTVWAGHALIAENGAILAETERFRFDTQIAIADVDVQRLVHERLRNSTFSASTASRTFRTVSFQLPGDLQSTSEVFRDLGGLRQPTGSRQTSEVTEDLGSRMRLIRPQLSRTPFVPSDPLRHAEHSREIFSIQSTALAKRLKHTGVRLVTIGVSGGLDSTLALLVTAKAFDILNLPRSGIVAITMPGFGTTKRTRGNAVQLAEALGVTLRTIPIVDAVRQHFRDIGHDEAVHDVTYENAQARANSDPDGCRQPGGRLRRRHRRPVRAGSGLGDVQRRSHVDVPRQLRRAQNPRALSGGMGRRG